MLNLSSKKYLPRDPHEGFSDEELLRLSCIQQRNESGYAPWASWEVENSSFGHTLREWTGFPAWLPICACSDHGVHWESRCWPNEIQSHYRLFLTWNSKKGKLMRQHHKKQVLHIPHPWISYRKRHYPKINSERKGTIVYFAHSNSTTTPVYKSLNAYMESLHDLERQSGPVVLCLSFHDILKGMHRKLRRYSFPIVTAGNTSSRFFVDRFYSISSQFTQACSPIIGSHVYYLVESGVPFFLYGSPPSYEIKGSKSVSDGLQDWREYGDDEDIENYRALHALFSDPSDTVTFDQLQAVERYLGANAKTCAKTLRHHLWTALLINSPHLVPLYSRAILRKSIDLIKKITKR